MNDSVMVCKRTMNKQDNQMSHKDIELTANDCSMEKADSQSGSIKINISEDLIRPKRKPILRKLLSPFLRVMRSFGLYYEDKEISFWNSASKFYVYFIVILLVAVFAQSIAGLFYVEHTNGYYSIGVEMIFKIKCVGQALSMLQICRKKTFWKFVEDIEEFLNGVNISRCSIAERHHSKILRRWLFAFLSFVIFCIAINVVMIIFPTDEFKLFEKIRMKPLEVSTVTEVVGMIIFFVSLGAWFLPIGLCGVLSQAMCYLFSEFYRYMKTEKGKNGLCVKKFIKEIREKFLQLTNLSAQLDSIFNNILMISYLTDICLICFVLRLGIYTFSSTWGRVFIFSWLVPPVFSLLSISHHASNLYDKGQEMVGYVQYFNTEAVTLQSKIQLDMLLFHLNTEPVVMTIWKMIPLYRSIVISVFVSILTYFALLISLL